MQAQGRPVRVVFALLVIHHGDGVALTDLAEFLGVTRHSVNRILRDLVRTLRLAPGELERRSDGWVRLRLTPTTE